MTCSKVSIIIPCYNAGVHIDKSVGSIYFQEYPNIELVIVNDGSTDDSEDKILAWQDKFEEKGFELKYFRQANQGQAAATNLALKYVTGEYLTLLDADDCFLPGSISKRCEFLDQNDDFAGVCSNGWYVRDDGRKLFVTSENEKRITDRFTALTYGKTNNWAGTYMLRTKILFEMYPDRNIFVSPYGQNFQILLPVAYKRKIGYIDEPLMEYYIYDNSHSHKSDPEEAYTVGKRNFSGWREIYINILQNFVVDKRERAKYKNIYDSSFYRGNLYLAIYHNKKDDVVLFYQALRKTKLATLEDRFCYHDYFKHPCLTLFFKILLKIQNTVHLSK